MGLPTWLSLGVNLAGAGTLGLIFRKQRSTSLLPLVLAEHLTSTSRQAKCEFSASYANLLGEDKRKRSSSLANLLTQST